MVQPAVICCILTPFIMSLIIVMITLLSLSIKRVSEGDQAIRFDDVSNTLHNRTYAPGMHTVLPDSKFYKYPAQLVNMDLRMVCRTSDAVEIVVSVTFQYTYIGNELPESFLNLGHKEQNAKYLKSHATAAIYHTCSLFTALHFTDQRAIVEFNMSIAVSEAMTRNRGNTHTTIGQFQLTNFQYPTEFRNAVNDKQKVQQQIEIELNRRQEILTSATTELLRAQQAVQIQLNDAAAVAKQLITEANLEAETEIAQWNEFILELDAEKENLGLTFEELLKYKENTLIGDASKAIINLKS